CAENVLPNATTGDPGCGPRSGRQTTARSRGERCTANSLGRSRPAHAAACAAAARYLSRPPCRATSREITDESRPSRRPISVYSRDSARPREISSRSTNINILRTVHPVPPIRQDQMLRPAEPKGVLSTMGLRLSPEKTLITHIDEGLDFLGWRIQRHRKRGTDRY